MDGNKLTYAGISLLAEVVAGTTTLTFSRIAFGNGTVDDDTDVQGLTDLVSSQLDLDILSAAKVTDASSDSSTGVALIKAQLSNADLTTGLRVVEVGIFVKDSDDNETLFAYYNAGDNYSYLPVASVMPIDEVYKAYVEIGDVESTSITIKSSTYVLADDLDDDMSDAIDAHNTDTTAHSDIRTAITTGITTAETYADDAITTHNADTDAHSDIRTAITTGITTAETYADSAVATGLKTAETYADSAVTTHNADTDAHSDIRALITSKIAAIDFSPYSPTGVINPYGGSSAPDGWLLCDGSAVSRTTYADLYDVIGTAFGEGDGDTTFNLPDLQAIFPMGVSSSYTLGTTGGEAKHALTTAEMPSHAHSASATATAAGVHTHVITTYEQSSGTDSARVGSANTTTATTSSPSTGSAGSHTHAVTVSVSATGSGSSHNNLPPYLAVNYIIRY